MPCGIIAPHLHLCNSISCALSCAVQAYPLSAIKDRQHTTIVVVLSVFFVTLQAIFYLYLYLFKTLVFSAFFPLFSLCFSLFFYIFNTIHYIFLHLLQCFYTI
nr:MAG TPA: hypothetical protein [Caudoviricetes sp.]